MEASAMAKGFGGLLDRLEDVPDPRRQCDNTKHLLPEILLLGFAAVLAGSGSFTEMAIFANERRAFFGTFLRLPNGVPSHDTFRAVFMAVDPRKLQAILVAWLAERLPDLDTSHVRLDGKTLRGSARPSSGLAALHTVTAWAGERGVLLAQAAVESKSNEIAAIPEVLDLLDLQGRTVTIDAAGCQRNIAAQIVEKEGDYLLHVKDNQPTLHAAVRDAFETAIEAGAKDLKTVETSEVGHGRAERRIVQSLPAKRLDGAIDPDDWKGLASLLLVIRIVSDPTTGEEKSVETRHYIGSMAPKVKRMAELARGHWGIENGLHWTLDVTFGEDGQTTADRTAAENMATMNRVAVSVLKHDVTRKASMRGKRYIAAINPDYLSQLLGIAGVPSA
jgi:predicted transposase YbfD/YdcC